MGYVRATRQDEESKRPGRHVQPPRSSYSWNVDAVSSAKVTQNGIPAIRHFLMNLYLHLAVGGDATDDSVDGDNGVLVALRLLHLSYDPLA